MTRKYTIPKLQRKSTGEISIYQVITDFSHTCPTLAIWIEQPQCEGEFVYFFPQPKLARELSSDTLFFIQLCSMFRLFTSGIGSHKE
jgi:hypothetical protein